MPKPIIPKHKRQKNWAILVALTAFIALIFLTTVSRMKQDITERTRKENSLERQTDRFTNSILDQQN